MTIEQSPGEILLAWFDSLPNEVKGDISALAVAAISDAELDLSAADALTKQFREWIQCIMTKDGLRHVGAVVHAKAIVDFTVMRHRGTAKQWQDTRATMQAAKQFALSQGADTSNFDRMIQELELRGQRWIKIVKDWRVLCSNDLSDDSLESWWQAATFPST